MGLVVLAMAAVWVLSIVAVHYPHELMAPARVEHFATCLNADVVLLAGTGFRAPEDSRHSTWKSKSDYWILDLGWARAPLANASAGCAFLPSSKKFLPKHVTSILVPQFAMASR